MQDLYGNPTSADATASKHLNRALDALLHFRPSILEHLNAALEHDPSFVLGQATRAYLGVLNMESGPALNARKGWHGFLSEANDGAWLERERLHARAASALVEGDFHGCASTLETILIAHPRDVLALTVGHHIDFFTGNTRMLRDRPAIALTSWEAHEPIRANILGMLAFGLEECHQHDRAFEVGLEAVSLDPKDVWALHAVGHTFEETGRFRDGMDFFDARLNDWTVGNFYNVHNWWHYALYALEANDIPRVLALVDAISDEALKRNLALSLSDASALLWRLKLEGHHEHERFGRIATAWNAKIEPAFHAFNDMHAAMAFVGANLEPEAEALIASREHWLATNLVTNPAVTASNVAMTRDIGLPVMRAVLAFARGQFAEVVSWLHPIRHRIHEFGGSHAQRDAVYKTLLEATLRGGQFALANALASERIAVRPRSPYNWFKHAEALEGLGQHTRAALARVTAKQRIVG